MSVPIEEAVRTIEQQRVIFAKNCCGDAPRPMRREQHARECGIDVRELAIIVDEPEPLDERFALAESTRAPFGV